MSAFKLCILPFAAVGVGCAYVPDSFTWHRPFPGVRATVGCLDVATAVLPSPWARGHVVKYSVGNRCDHVTVVDFPSVRVRGADGPSLAGALSAYDPGHELRPLHLEARSALTELVEYIPAATAEAGICIDLARLNGAASDARWTCHAPSPYVVASTILHGGDR